MSKVSHHRYVPTTGCLNLSAICKLDTRIKKTHDFGLLHLKTKYQKKKILPFLRKMKKL